MNWQTDTVRSTFDATSNAINTMSNRESQRAGSTVGTFKKGGINIFGMNIGGKTTSNLPASSIVGMNVNQVETMRNAIEDYCLDIETYLRNLNPTAEAGVAFKSAAVTKALTTYMDNVKTYCLNLVSQLRAFSDKLADVKNQWEIATGNMAESIGSTSGDSFATGTAYTRQIQSGGSSTGGGSGVISSITGVPESSNSQESNVEQFTEIRPLGLKHDGYNADGEPLYVSSDGKHYTLDGAMQNLLGAKHLGEASNLHWRLPNGKVVNDDMAFNLLFENDIHTGNQDFMKWVNDPKAAGIYEIEPLGIEYVGWSGGELGVGETLYQDKFGNVVPQSQIREHINSMLGVEQLGRNEYQMSDGKIIDADMYGSLQNSYDVWGKPSKFINWLNDPNGSKTWDYAANGNWWED